MFVNSAKKLTNSLINNGVIKKSDFDLYSFGFETGLAMVANILTTFLIGIAFCKPLESLLFLTAFIPLRSYVGGFHASNHFRCYCLSILAVSIVLLVAQFVLNSFNVVVIIGVGTICTIVIFFLVPVQDSNRPLDEIEIRVYRQRARFVLCTEFFVMVALSITALKTIVSVLFCTLCLICMSACIGAIKNCVKS